ncbi:pyridoxal phosphate-dependent transferase [Tanacetum coccineum]
MKSYPYVDIDMRSAVVDGYDAITLSLHKFLGRPGSPGILLMNKALYQLKNSPPLTCGTVNYVDYYDEKKGPTVASTTIRQGNTIAWKLYQSADGQSKLRVTTVTRRWVETDDVTKVPWSNERPLENKELNAIIGAWFTLWRD